MPGQKDKCSPFYSIQVNRARRSYVFCSVSLKWQFTGSAQFLKPTRHKLDFTSHFFVYTSPLAEHQAGGKNSYCNKGNQCFYLDKSLRREHHLLCFLQELKMRHFRVSWQDNAPLFSPSLSLSFTHTNDRNIGLIHSACG